MSDKDNEASTFLGRLKRYGGVTTGLAGVAARGAGRWLGGKGLLDESNARDLARMLGALRGPLMKVAQIAGGLPDVLPPAFAAELAKLQSNAPEMGAAFVRRRMAAELGADWKSRFDSFDLVASHAASLGQVHRATSPGGLALACKLQYPAMESAVEADVAQLKTVLVLQRTAERKIDTREIAEEVTARIREELDYKREAANMRLFAHIFEGHARIAVPEPIEALSTRRLLTMTWLDGAPFRDALGRTQAERDAIALTLFDAWFMPLLRFGVIHGDAHLGNYTLRADGGINLLDFGCIRIFEPRVVQGVIDLYRAMQSGDRALAGKAYEEWGFEAVDDDLVEKMNSWARVVFGPMLEDRARLIVEGAADNGVQQIWTLKQRLREGGVVRPPRAFVFIARALVGIGSALVQLGARQNWHAHLEAFIADFDPQTLSARQAAALDAARLTVPS